MNKQLNNALSIAVVMIGGLMIMVQLVVAVAGTGPIEPGYMVLLHVLFIAGFCLFLFGLATWLELWWRTRNEQKVMMLKGNMSAEFRAKDTMFIDDGEVRETREITDVQLHAITCIPKKEENDHADTEPLENESDG